MVNLKTKPTNFEDKPCAQSLLTGICIHEFGNPVIKICIWAARTEMMDSHRKSVNWCEAGNNGCSIIGRLHAERNYVQIINKIKKHYTAQKSYAYNSF